MPIKLNVSVCRKEGREHYGSEGATCSIEIEADASLADNPELLHAKVRALYRLCDRAVAAQIAGDPGPEPEHAPPPPRRPDRDPEPPRDRSPDRNGYDRQSQPAYSSPQSSAPGPHRTQVNRKAFEGDPRTGKALFRWAKEQDGLYDFDLVKWMMSWARLQEFPDRFDQWEPGQVAQCVRAVKDRIGLVSDR